MKLDIRIKSISDIFTCTNMEEAKQFIGKRGYFADCMISFEDLSQRELYNLDRIDDEEIPFVSSNVHWRYFLPVDKLKSEEIKYVPLQTTHDLGDANLYLGNIINFVNTKFLDVVHRAVINEVTYDDNTKELIDITLGNTTYSFESLFNNYQILDSNDKWVPFGKRVEE